MSEGKLFSLHKRKTKRGVYWYCQFKRLDGTFGTAKSTGEHKRSEAEKWAINYLKKGRIVTRENVRLRDFAAPDFFGWDSPYAVDRRTTGKRISKRQCTEKARLLKNHILSELGDRKLTAIDRATIRDFRNTLFKRELSGSTINKTLTCLRAVLEAAEEANLIQAVPKTERAADRPRKRGILNHGEVWKLFNEAAWPDQRSRVASMVAASTGLRQGELLGLQHKAVLENGFLHVYQAWSESEHLKDTKTGTERFVPVPGRVRTELDSLMAANPHKEGPERFVFYSHSPRAPMGGRRITEDFYSVLETIGIDKTARGARHIDFHSWRHFFNSTLINARVPILKVQSLTGHVSDAMTERYYSPDQYGDVLRVTEGIFKKPTAST